MNENQSILRQVKSLEIFAFDRAVDTLNFMFRRPIAGLCAHHNLVLYRGTYSIAPQSGVAGQSQIVLYCASQKCNNHAVLFNITQI